MKKIFITILAAVFTLLVFLPVSTYSADSNHVHIYLFHSKYCPHCAAERKFLDEYEKENENIEVYLYEVGENPDNYKLLQKVADKLDISSQSVPITIICGKTIVGFDDYGVIEEKLRKLVNECYETGCEDPVREILLNQPDDEGNQCSEPDQTTPVEDSVTPISDEKIHVPILGEVKLSEYSLPVITILIGFLDGFNPCAMWVLLYLISMLFGMKDRKKMWIIGTTFIIASGFVYFLFMTSWLNFFLFIGYVKWVRWIIGAIAIFSGFLHLRDWWESRPGCKVTDDEKRKRISERIKVITSDNRFWVVIAGIIALAFSVNLIELVCSAGFPAIYTHLLSLSDLTTIQYYLYILLYILMFMIDDLAVFFIAMITLHATGISTKYKKISALVGGIMILLIGLLLIFKPELLMFS